MSLLKQVLCNHVAVKVQSWVSQSISRTCMLRHSGNFISFRSLIVVELFIFIQLEHILIFSRHSLHASPIWSLHNQQLLSTFNHDGKKNILIKHFNDFSSYDVLSRFYWIHIVVLLLNNVFYPQQTSKKSTGTVKSKKSGSKGRSKSPGKAASAKSKPSSSRSKSSRKGGPIGLEGAVSDRMFVCLLYKRGWIEIIPNQDVL